MPLTIYAWAVADPTHARSICADLKRSWRIYLVRRNGQAAAAELAHSFLEQARSQGLNESGLMNSSPSSGLSSSKAWAHETRHLAKAPAGFSLGDLWQLRHDFTDVRSYGPVSVDAAVVAE